MSEGIRVMVVDDHPAFRFGIRTLLETAGDMRVVAEAANGLEAMSYLEQAKPEIVLLDIQMPGPDGLSMVGRLTKMDPDAKVVMLTAVLDERSMLDAFAAGAYGYVTKNEAADRIVEVVRKVHAGQHVLNGAQIETVLSGLSELKNQNQAARTGLTDREIELLRHLADGESYAEISESMFISQSTIKRMVETVVTKLGASNKIQAVAMAFQLGLI